jgi:hypothetical protein
MARKNPHQLASQPLIIGAQKHVGDADPGLRRELAGKLRQEREAFV